MFEFTTIEELRNQLIEWNRLYRIGEPIIDDHVYDHWFNKLRLLSPDDPFLKETGYIDMHDERRQKLPINSKSMEKIKTIEELHGWAKKKGIPMDTYMCITGKYDGISGIQMANTNNDITAWTKGRGGYGNMINNHIKHMFKGRFDRATNPDTQTIFSGEFIIPKHIFIEKYQKSESNIDGYENPRNMVGGKFNNKHNIDPNIMKDIVYVCYDSTYKMNWLTKSKLLDTFNNDINLVHVGYKLIKLCDITEELMHEIYVEFSDYFEIDGLIVEVNEFALADKIKPETSNGNPGHARAYKAEYGEEAETMITELVYQMAKSGKLSPVIKINPVRVDGVTISSVYPDNSRWLWFHGLGVGSKITIHRSGMVIPRIKKINGERVISAAEIEDKIKKSIDEELMILRDRYSPFNYKPLEEYIDNSGDIHHPIWDENKVDMIITASTIEQRQAEVLFFFKNLGVKGISDKTIEDFFDRGYDTVKSILELTPHEMSLWANWGTRKAEKIHSMIHSKCKKVFRHDLMHSSNMFQGLGSKKLRLLNHFTEKPTVEDVESVEGFAEISAKVFVENWDRFWEFANSLGLEIINNPDEWNTDFEISNDGKLSNTAFVFTGFRSKELEELVKINGGEIKSSVSSKTTHVVCADKSSTSSKVKKAKADENIKLWDKSELEMFLGIEEKSEKSLW